MAGQPYQWACVADRRGAVAGVKLRASTTDYCERSPKDHHLFPSEVHHKPVKDIVKKMPVDIVFYEIVIEIGQWSEPKMSGWISAFTIFGAISLEAKK